METFKHRSQCPLTIALDLVGDKWSLLLVRDSLFFNKRRYSEFLNSRENISTNILASRLKQLESFEILEKFRDPEDGKSMLYIPTERAVNLLPMIVATIRWSISELESCPPPNLIMDLLKNGTKLYMKEKSNALQQERAALI